MRIVQFIVSFVLFFCSVSAEAYASGKIYYGSRAGMTVTVVSIQGLNSARAVIRTTHTREDAIGFCRDYVQNVTPSCVDEELAKPLNDAIYANCMTGDFSDFYGVRYRFEGKFRGSSDVTMAHYIIRDLSSHKIADGSSASGYPINIGIFRALCPIRAPVMQEE